MMVTGENQTKRQKNGNVHRYVYYHCTKSARMHHAVLSRTSATELLDEQLSAMLQEYTMPTVWADKLRELMEKT